LTNISTSCLFENNLNRRELFIFLFCVPLNCNTYCALTAHICGLNHRISSSYYHLPRIISKHRQSLKELALFAPLFVKLLVCLLMNVVFLIWLKLEVPLLTREFISLRREDLEVTSVLLQRERISKISMFNKEPRNKIYNQRNYFNVITIYFIKGKFFFVIKVRILKSPKHRLWVKL